MDEDEDEKARQRAEWEAWYAEEIRRKDRQSGVDLFRDLAERNANEGRRPPKGGPKTKTKTGGSTPPGKDETCSENQEAQAAHREPAGSEAVDPDEESGRLRMRELLASKRRRQTPDPSS